MIPFDMENAIMRTRMFLEQIVIEGSKNWVQNKGENLFVLKSCLDFISFCSCFSMMQSNVIASATY